MDKTLTKTLTDLYTNPKSSAAFASATRLYGEAKKVWPRITLKEIRLFLRTQPSYTLHKPVRRKFKRGPVIVNGLYDQSDLDLADMSNVKSQNMQFTFLIILIDIFSRYASVEPIKTKTAMSVYNGMIIIFERLKESGRSLPKKIRHDQGSEFENKDFKRLMKDNYITDFSTTNYLKANYAERFIRTLKERIHRYQTLNKTKRYYDVLQDIVTSYNSGLHSSIKMAPKDVTKQNETELWDRLYGRIKQDGPSTYLFDIGQQVRIQVKKDPYAKGYIAGWRETVFTVVSRGLRTGIPVYKIADLRGYKLPHSFYTEELQAINVSTEKKILKVLHTRTTKGKKEYNVEWSNFGDGYNT